MKIKSEIVGSNVWGGWLLELDGSNVVVINVMGKKAFNFDSMGELVGGSLGCKRLFLGSHG